MSTGFSINKKQNFKHRTLCLKNFRAHSNKPMISVLYISLLFTNISTNHLMIIEKRKQTAQRILEKYTDRVPVIVEPGKADAPKIKKQKFLVPRDLSVGKFAHEIKKNLEDDNANKPDKGA